MITGKHGLTDDTGPHRRNDVFPEATPKLDPRSFRTVMASGGCPAWIEQGSSIRLWVD